MSDNTIFETSVPETQPKGQVGEPANPEYKARYLANPEPQQRKEVTITVDTASDDTEYSYDVVGGTVAITTGSGVSKEDVVDALVQEHNTSPLIRGEVEAIKDATDKVLLAGLEPGQDFSFSESDGNLSSSTTQSAQEADPTGIGLAVREDGTEADETGLTKQRREYTHPGTSAAITLEAEREVARFSGASASAVASAINGDSHFGDILDASNPTGEELVIEVKVAGDSFEVVDADEMASLDSVTRGDRIEEFLAGVSINKFQISESAEKFEYGGTRGVLVMEEGEIYVAGGDSASKGDGVYVYLSGANVGEFTDSRVADETAWIEPEYLEWDDSEKLKIRLHS